jgi:type VI secretion system protein ImpJ
MSMYSKVIWSEGMFLNPQHFQQQDRYFEHYIESKFTALGAYGWGFQELEVDHQLLKLGKISITRAKGVFPDGTPFNFPEVDDAPPVMDVPPGMHGTIVYLAVPVKRVGALDVLPKDSTQGLARFYPSETQIRDITTEGGDSQSIDVGKLRVRLLLETDDLSGYACIGTLRIAESREDKNVLLDENYYATCLDCSAVPKLAGFIGELYGLLHHRGEAIAGRLADTRHGGTAEIADYMLLQVINRLEPYVNHLSTTRGLHPQVFYGEALKMVGELSTFIAKGRRPPEFGAYRHDELFETFSPLFKALRQCLSAVYEQTAISLSLEEKKYGIRVSEIADRSLLSTATFVLAVYADVKDDVLRTRLPAQIKIGPVERIRQLVNAAMPGIGVKPLPVAPRQIPFRSGYSYFELDKHSTYWRELQNSGGFALHLAGDFPGIQMEFWAIRQ